MGLFSFLEKKDIRKDSIKSVVYYKQPNDLIKSDIGGREGKIITAKAKKHKINNYEYLTVDSLNSFPIGSMLTEGEDYNIHMGYFIEENGKMLCTKPHVSIAECFDSLTSNINQSVYKVPVNSNIKILKDSDELFFPELLERNISPIFINGKHDICRSNGFYYFLYKSFDNNNRFVNIIDESLGPKIFYGFYITDINNSYVFERCINILNSVDTQNINTITELDGLYENNSGGLSYLKKSFFAKNMDDYKVYVLPKSYNWNCYKDESLFIFKKEEIIDTNLNEYVNSLKSERIRIMRDDKLSKIGI